MSYQKLSGLVTAGIRERISQLGLTNTAITQITGWNRSYVSLVKSGKSSPIPRLDEWCRVTRSTPENLIRIGREHE